MQIKSLQYGCIQYGCDLVLGRREGSSEEELTRSHPQPHRPQPNKSNLPIKVRVLKPDRLWQILCLAQILPVVFEDRGGADGGG